MLFVSHVCVLHRILLGTTFLRNVHNHTTHDTTSHPTSLYTSESPLPGTYISHQSSVLPTSQFLYFLSIFSYSKVTHTKLKLGLIYCNVSQTLSLRHLLSPGYEVIHTGRSVLTSGSVTGDRLFLKEPKLSKR